MPRWRAVSADAHPAGGEGGQGFGEFPAPEIVDGTWRAQNDLAGQCAGTGRLAHIAEVDADGLIISGDLFQRAVDIDWGVVAGLTQECDHALCLAERVGADKMRAFRKNLLRGEQFVDLDMGLRVPEDREAECRFADKRVTGERNERFTSRIALAFIITRDDGPGAATCEQNLRGAQHMAGRMKTHVNAAEIEHLAIARGLRRAGEIVAIADRHDRKRLSGSQHSRVTGTRVVGMSMGDECARHRAQRIDKKSPAAQ